MNNYNTVDIRNIVILGDSGSGKTTLVEAVAFTAGSKDKLGSISEGNTVSDYDKEEVNRKFSINLSVIPVEWNGCKINLIDTPGNLDFSGERESGASAADAAVIVINGRRGIDFGVDAAWKLCDKYKLPRIIFVTGMDDDTASFREIIESLTQKYGSRIAPFHMPIRQEQMLIGYVDITRMTGKKYVGIGKAEDMEIPDYCMPNLQQFRNALNEAVASADEENMEKFFMGEGFSQMEVDCALRTNCIDGSIIPVTFGSGLHVHGVNMLLDTITRYLPAPTAVKTGVNVNDNELFDCIYDSMDYLVAQVFKTISDPYLGRYSLVKVYSGRLKADSNAFNPSNDTEQKIGRLYYMNGNQFIPTDSIVAGDIGAIPKLNDMATGNTITTRVWPIKLNTIPFERPYTLKRYVTTDSKDDDKIYVSLLKMLEEDKTLSLKSDMANAQQLIAGIGEQQLDILVSRMFNKYKIKIELQQPKIAYRETICKRAKASGRYKKQSGGHGQFGDVVMTFEPSGDRGIPYIFEEQIVGGVVPGKYIPAVEKGVEESVKKGLLAGYPVIGIRAVLADGSFHPVDSSDNAFTMAAIMAFKEAYMQAEPILLEPIAAVRIFVPARYTGDVISELKSRRARIMGMVPDNERESYIEADIPMSELDGYMTSLRSISGGYGTFEYQFSRYGQAPEDITRKQAELFKNS